MHTYDAFNRWIGQTIDDDGDGTVDTTRQFVQDGGQVALAFKDGQLTNRYLWSTAVDELLAGESIASGQIFGDTRWVLTDHLGSVRDLVNTESETVYHAVYDAYGKVLKIDGEIGSLFGFTGRAYDNATGLQNNHHRWYDAGTGRWLSQDPIGFAAGDANLYRYVGNQPTTKTDPSGLWEESGHFYTVYIVSRLAKFSHQDAMTMAGYAQYLDEVEAFDAAFMGLKHREATWKDAANAVGTEMSNLNDAWEEVVQQCLHQLHGGNHAKILNNRRMLETEINTAIQNKDLRRAGLLLHSYGDSYAHTFKARDGSWHAFGTRVGHAFAKGPASGKRHGGHAVDYIRERYADGAYPKYVKDLAALLGVPQENMAGVDALIERLRPIGDGSTTRNLQWPQYTMPNSSTEEIKRLRTFNFGTYVGGPGYSYDSCHSFYGTDYSPESGRNPMGNFDFNEMRKLAWQLWNKLGK